MCVVQRDTSQLKEHLRHKAVVDRNVTKKLASKLRTRKQPVYLVKQHYLYFLLDTKFFEGRLIRPSICMGQIVTEPAGDSCRVNGR